MRKQFASSEHIIYHGEVLEVLKQKINDESVDLIFADPPYNIGKNASGLNNYWSSSFEYINWAYQWIDECLRVLKPTGTMYLMASTELMPYLDLYLSDRFTVLNRIAWLYTNSDIKNKKNHDSLYEPILHCIKSIKLYRFDDNDITIKVRTKAKRHFMKDEKPVPKMDGTQKILGKVWEFPKNHYPIAEHEEQPRQKSEALLERVILTSSNKNDMVLDLFTKTFKTAMVAKRLDRKSISIESQAKHA